VYKKISGGDIYIHREREIDRHPKTLQKINLYFSQTVTVKS